MKIALVSDFFYPKLGGVEQHIYCLAQCLIRQGHKVIVITHAYESLPGSNARTGVRYLPGILKVYYCPIKTMVEQTCLPTFCATLPILRHIFEREGIEIVHSHQSTSTLAHEAIAYAAELGLASVYTDHSLFGFDDLASVVLNKVIQSALSTIGAAICVSHTCRENLIMRANLDPTIVHAIPNAIDSLKFQPNTSKRCTERVKIVVISRLVYRKGVDLLVGIIPIICQHFPYVDFIIGGDGSKKLALEEMVERERLQERVEFLGSVPHSKVRDVLVRGHIFLNCSLTESFCIAILEAASCGLFVVSTKVGGVPEVLPDDMIMMAKPTVEDLKTVLSEAIREKIGKNGKAITFDSNDFHQRIASIYSWDQVAFQTVEIYRQVLAKERLTFLRRLARYKSTGPISGFVTCFIAVTLHILVKLLLFFQPKHTIDIAPDLSIYD